jgi:hypothetical protein
MNISLRLLPSATLAILYAAGCASSPSRSERSFSDALTSYSREGHPIFTYHTRPPASSKLVVDSGDFFHPVTTPKGIPVTDLAPSDHPHHRGVFLAWVEMHGAKDADFWGWGQLAPTKERRIVNRSVSPVRFKGSGATFEALNDWRAEGVTLLEEKLQVASSHRAGINLLDLKYTLTPKSDLTLSKAAFSGFCVRVRKDAELLGAYSPEGLVSRPDPHYLTPTTDWPDSSWYAYSLKSNDGATFGAALINDPANPHSLWHNHREVRMLNPCIVAPNEVRLQAGKPLTLHYTVATFDGPVPAAELNRIAGSQ